MPGASRTVEIDVSPDKLFDIIVDYERYPEFLSDVSSVQVVSRSEGQAVVEYGLNLIKKVSYSLRMREERPHRVSWTLEKSSIMKANVGGWELEALPNGHTRATYTVDVTPRGFVPGPIVSALTGRTLPATLAAFKARAEGT
jgi:ribosome-associated toxin RatA of RatAB toxin-antitoxin module